MHVITGPGNDYRSWHAVLSQVSRPIRRDELPKSLIGDDAGCIYEGVIAEQKQHPENGAAERS